MVKYLNPAANLFSDQQRQVQRHMFVQSCAITRLQCTFQFDQDGHLADSTRYRAIARCHWSIFAFHVKDTMTHVALQLLLSN